MNRRWAEAALVLNALIWGATFVLVKEALLGITPLAFLALRFSLASVALLVLFRRSWNDARAARKAAFGGVLTGVFLFSGYLLQTMGLRLTTAPRSAFLTGLSTVMVPLLAALVYRIRPRVTELLGVTLAISGMGLMMLHGEPGAVNHGDLLTFFCAIAFAAHILAVGHYSREVSFELLSITQVGTSAVLALSAFWWAETPSVHWRPAVVYAILITGLLATALAFTIQAWSQRYTTPTRTALIFALEPVFAWMTSYWIAGEGLSGRAAAGAALILCGVLLVELKPMNPGLHPSQ